MIEIIAVIVIEVLLIAIAMLCRSLVHNLLHHYSEVDELLNLDDEWWNPAISHKNKYAVKWTIKLFRWTVIKFKIPVQVSDAFHTFNTIELGAFDLAITIPLTLYLGLSLWIGLIIFLIVGVMLMPLFFNLGYDKLWR